MHTLQEQEKKIMLTGQPQKEFYGVFATCE